MPNVTIERTITNRMPRGFPTGPGACIEVAGRGGWATESGGGAGSASPSVVGSSGVSLTRTTPVVDDANRKSVSSRPRGNWPRS
jgi:hypothetical protein